MSLRTPAVTHRASAWPCACMLVLLAAQALAQEPVQPSAAKPPDKHGLLSSVGRWFDEQATRINSGLNDAGRRVANFGREAGIAARTTAGGATDAATAVARIPTTRVVAGHEKCLAAPNGAPDCLAAANLVCRANGFESGKSVDMTTAQTCPPKVYMAGRSSGPECTTETFVSRALCQ